MYINWFTCIIFIHDCICCTKYRGYQEFSRYSQRYGKLSLPWWKQGNYPLFIVYGVQGGTSGIIYRFWKMSANYDDEIVQGVNYLHWLQIKKSKKTLQQWHSNKEITGRLQANLQIWLLIAMPYPQRQFSYRARQTWSMWIFHKSGNIHLWWERGYYNNPNLQQVWHH